MKTLKVNGWEILVTVALFITVSILAAWYGHDMGYVAGEKAGKDGILTILNENIFTKMGDGCKDEVTKLTHDWEQRIRDGK